MSVCIYPDRQTKEYPTMYFRLMGKLNARRKGLLAEDEKGFTLIELLVVVIIIGILAAIAIPVYLGVQNNAKDSAVKSDVANAKTAVVSEETSSGALPTAFTIDDTAKAAGATKSQYSGTFTYNTDTATPPTHFCVSFEDTATNKTFAADDNQGVIQGTCIAGVATAPAA